MQMRNWGIDIVKVSFEWGFFPIFDTLCMEIKDVPNEPALILI